MNYTQIKQKLFTIIPKPLCAILVIACIVRLIVVVVIVNFNTNFYWEYGEIAKNVLAGRGYSLSQDRKFEVHLDHLYHQRAFNFITSHPWQECSNIPVKLFHLWVFSPLEERFNNYWLQIVSGCFFIFSLIGLLATLFWERHKYLYLFLLYSTIIGLVFFTLPKHQTMMKIVLAPMTGAGLEFLWNLCRRKMKNIRTTNNSNHSM